MAYFFLNTIISFLFFSSVTMAQTGTAGPNEKAALAKELMIVLEVDKSLQDRITNLDKYLDFMIKTTRENPETEKKAVAKIKIQLPSIKEKLLMESQDRFVKEVGQQFSVVELKYLVQAYKHPLNKKFKAFLSSDGYNKALDLPYKEIKKAVAEARQSIKAEESKVIKKGP